MVTSMSRGHSFFESNQDLLDRYAACSSAQEVLAAQNHSLQELRETHAPKKIMPTSDSDEEEDYNDYEGKNRSEYESERTDGDGGGS